MAESMPTEYVLRLPVPPLLNRKYRSGKGRVYVSKQHKDYVKGVWHEVMSMKASDKVIPLVGDVGMEVVWYRKYKKGDIDSPIKTLLDSLQGLLYVNDSQICDLRVVRDDTKHSDPHIAIRVWDIDAEYYIDDQTQ